MRCAPGNSTVRSWLHSLDFQAFVAGLRSVDFQVSCSVSQIGRSYARVKPSYRLKEG